jgi:hypothetical protein
MAGASLGKGLPGGQQLQRNFKIAVYEKRSSTLKKVLPVLTKNHDTRTYGRMELYLHIFLISAPVEMSGLLHALTVLPPVLTGWEAGGEGQSQSGRCADEVKIKSPPRT